jgi:hypothetical protein
LISPRFTPALPFQILHTRQWRINPKPGGTRTKWGPGSRTKAKAFFRPDGRQILAVGTDWAARLWDFTPDDRAVTDWLLLARVQAGREFDATGAVAPLSPAEARAAWEEFHRRLRADATISPGQARSWFVEEAHRLLAAGHADDAGELLKAASPGADGLAGAGEGNSKR